jgi:phage gpG-like protein
MAETEISVELHGFESLARRVNEMRQQCSDLRPMFEQISADFYKQEKTVFSLKGPGQYQDLSEQYQIQKQRKFGFVYPILFATGKLAHSLTNRGSSDAVNVITKTGFVIGTSVPYAVYHHSQEPRTKMPWRPLWDPSTDSAMWKRWGRLIEAYVKKIEEGLLK